VSVICSLRFEDGPPWLPPLAAAGIIMVIMTGQRMRQPARGCNGTYTSLLAACAAIPGGITPLVPAH